MSFNVGFSNAGQRPGKLIDTSHPPKGGRLAPVAKNQGKASRRYILNAYLKKPHKRKKSLIGYYILNSIINR